MKIRLFTVALVLATLLGVCSAEAAKPSKRAQEPQITLPEESLSIVTFEIDSLPAVAVIDAALTDFEHKKSFEWHCSLIIECKELVENGMPSPTELELLDKFEDELSKNLAGDSELPNAIFFARITHNGTRQLIWKVGKPKQAYDYLKSVMEADRYPRNFEFVIERDVDWKMTEYLSEMVRK